MCFLNTCLRDPTEVKILVVKTILRHILKAIEQAKNSTFCTQLINSEKNNIKFFEIRSEIQEINDRIIIACNPLLYENLSIDILKSMLEEWLNLTNNILAKSTEILGKKLRKQLEKELESFDLFNYPTYASDVIEDLLSSMEYLSLN